MIGLQRLALAAVALALPACHAVLWEGHGVDRRTAARVVAEGDVQRVEIGGRAHHGFAAVAPETLAFAADGAVAYGARIARGWTVVVDGRAILPAAERLSLVTWATSPGTSIAVVGDGRGDRVVVVRDATSARPRVEAGPWFDAILAGSIATTDAGAVAYVGTRGGRSRVMVDQHAGPWLDGIARLHLAPDGAPSYLARRGGAAFVVRRGVVGPSLVDVADLVADASGARAVALVRTADGWHTDDGRSRSAAYAAIGDLRVTAGHTAFRAVRGDGHVVVVDGVEAGVWPAVEEVALGEDGRVGVVARDGGMRLIVVDGELLGAFEWAGDLRMGRGGVVFAARERGRDLVIDRRRRRVIDGLVRGSLRLASDGVTWGVLVHDAEGLALETASGRRVPFDVGELVDATRRRQAGAPTDVLDAWSRAELERAL